MLLPFFTFQGDPSTDLPPIHRSSTASVNDEEVKKFEAYGAGWWDEKGRTGAGILHTLIILVVPPSYFD